MTLRASVRTTARKHSLRQMTTKRIDESLGFVPKRSPEERTKLRNHLLEYIALKLIANGQPVPVGFKSADPLGAQRILNSYHQRLRQLDTVRPPADQRIEAFLSLLD